MRPAAHMAFWEALPSDWESSVRVQDFSVLEKLQ